MSSPVTTVSRMSLLALFSLPGCGGYVPRAGTPPSEMRRNMGETTPAEDAQGGQAEPESDQGGEGDADSGPIEAGTPNPGDSIERASPSSGSEILAWVVKKRGLDPYYASPVIWGAATSSPSLVACLPFADYEALTPAELRLLVEFLRSEVGNAKSDPWPYMRNQSRTAPLAPQLAANVRGMGEDDWGVLLGNVQGRDLGADRLVRSREVLRRIE